VVADVLRQSPDLETPGLVLNGRGYPAGSRTGGRHGPQQSAVLDAIERYRRENHLGFIPPGHQQGRGVDPRALRMLGPDVFSADLIKLNGLDDREMSGNVITNAEELMADAVDADRAFFSTCGSSLSVKTCIIIVAAPSERLLLSRNAHKSVVAGLIISGVHPVWVHPRWDATWSGRTRQNRPKSRKPAAKRPTPRPCC
jgi:arginine decarboxylase